MPVYTEIVQKVSTGEITEDGGYKGIGFDIEKDSDGVTRIAFPDGTGIIDNWCGLIWDPSGMISTVTNVSKKLFGGDLIGSKNLKGFWYISCFT